MWTCSEFMFVTRKPHAMGNEYHSICCELLGIICYIKMAEDKGAPKEREIPKFQKYGKSSGMLLILCDVIFFMRKVIILDTCFFVIMTIFF